MFMKTIYVVHMDCRIDGGAPGYVTVGFFDKKEDANELAGTLNMIKSVVTNEDVWMKILDKLNDSAYNPFKYGYSELWACEDEKFYVSEIKIPESVDEFISENNLKKYISIELKNMILKGVM